MTPQTMLFKLDIKMEMGDIVSFHVDILQSNNT